MPRPPRATLWAQRHVLRALWWRQWRDRYAGSALGGLWALLQPLAQLALYALVFQWIFQVRLPQATPGQPYVVWLALGLWPWMALQEALVRGAGAVVQQAALVQKVAFDSAWLVVAAVGAAFALHGLGHALVLVALALGGAALSPALLWQWPLTWLALLGVALGAAFWLAAAQVYVRDVEPLLPQVLPLLMYASPVLYPLALVPPALQAVLAVNPLTGLLEPLRAAALGWGSGWSPWQAAGALGLCAAWAALGWWGFHRLSPDFEDAL
ncbi:ABC transporter permease [Tepidimonas fonticaldi]|uniref:ABC transporter permease n=1 Tax=Tepidimonas fonticaldi TaxID=1101373 RepID=UPI0018D28064|nr:ABC transporter permease [Tepidimonas fonticaldi]